MSSNRYYHRTDPCLQQSKIVEKDMCRLTLSGVASGNLSLVKAVGEARICLTQRATSSHDYLRDNADTMLTGRGRVCRV